VFRFIETEKATFPVAFLCRALGMSPSGCYAWRERPRSARGVADAALNARIWSTHAASRRTSGAPRIHAELTEVYETRGGRKRVVRLMRAAGLVGVCRRRIVQGRPGGNYSVRGRLSPNEAALDVASAPAP
jgi:hypothetical protein